MGGMSALPQGFVETSGQRVTSPGSQSPSACDLFPGPFGEETVFLPQDHSSLVCSQ